MRMLVVGTVLRNLQNERRTFARRAPHLHGAAMGFGDLACYGKPEARTTPRACLIRPIEALEDAGQFLIRDSHAGIADGHPNLAVTFVCPYPNLSSFRRVLYGIVQKYGERLPDAAAVKDRDDLVLRKSILDGDFAARSVSCDPRCLLGDGAEILRFKLEWSPFVAASQGKQFLSQVPHAPRLFPNRLHTFSCGFWILERPFLEHLCVALDVGEGGSEFVAGVCDKTSPFPKHLLDGRRPPPDDLGEHSWSRSSPLSRPWG